jgi:RecA/RadA recombinase
MASKFTKTRKKAFATIKSSTINVGFSSINKWVDMGNFAMNRIMSGKFNEGLLFGRNYVYYGESGSGKSLQAAYACAHAQKDHDAFVLWIDVEKATDDVSGQEWLTRAGVDLDEENFEYMSAATLGNVKKTISEMCKMYRAAYEDKTDSFERPIVIVVDSWSAALTQKQWEEAEKGELIGDMGQKAKQTGDVVQSITHLCSHLPVLVIGVGHVMDNQDGYGGKHKTTGGHKMFYMASGCLMMTKAALKTDDKNRAIEDQEAIKYYEALKKGMTKELAKQKQIVGHVCVIDNLKSRASKPGQRIEIQVPFNTGMDPYSGLFDLLMFEGAITVPSAGWYQIGTGDGITKFRRKDFRTHAKEAMKWADDLNPNGIRRPMTEAEIAAELAADDLAAQESIDDDETLNAEMEAENNDN